MTTENLESLTPPPFDEADKGSVQSADAPALEVPTSPVVDNVGEAVSSNVEPTLSDPNKVEDASGTESAGDIEDEVTFDLLMRLDKKNLKALLGKVSPTVAATALVGMETEAKEKVLSVLSKGVAGALQAEMAKLGTPIQDSVEKAQEEIVEIAENLNEEGTISLDSLFEEETESTAKSTAQPSSAAASKTIERHKTPEELEAEAFTDYFKSVKTHEEFLAGVVDMPRNAKLREVVNVRKLEKLSGELYEKLFGFFLEFEARKKGKSPTEIIKFIGAFIEEEKIPAGCQSAIRAIAHAEMTQKTEPVSADTKTKARVDAILADLAQEKEKQTGASDVSSSKSKRSFEWLLKPKGTRHSVSSAPDQPVATKTTETPSTPPLEPEVASPTPVPQVETNPLTPPDTSGKEQAIPLMVTRDMEQQLADMGIGREERNKLNPFEVWKILRGEKEKGAEQSPSLPETVVSATGVETTADMAAAPDKIEELVAHENIPESQRVTRESIEPEIILPPRPEPVPPAPVEQAPVAPPSSASSEKSKTSSASSGWWSKVVNFFRRSASEQVKGDSAVSPEVEKVWTLDEVKALKFEDIFSFGASDFKIVVGVGNGLTWGTALAGEKDAGVRAKVASAMNNPIDLRNFQEGLKEVHEQGEIESAKARCVTYAKKQLIREHLSY